MPPSHAGITHVSDTALMVAACRQLETENPGGFVNDPFAALLAGERGLEILKALPNPAMMQFGIGVRSRFIDELLLDALAATHVATVLSLGCGLDTRPWRLELRPDLRWIEVDFADMLDYKDRVMSAGKPNCRRERVVADVTDAGQRRAVYTAVGPAPALMITEGLLLYLPAPVVGALAAEVGQQSGVAQWISDLTTTAFAKVAGIDLPQSIRNVQASDFLQGEQVLDVLQGQGWRIASRRSYIADMGFAMDRIQQLFAKRDQAAGKSPSPPPAEDPTGVLRFARL